MKIVLNEFELLTPGVHDHTLKEIDEAFGQFQRSDRRLKLSDQLRLFAEEVWKVDVDIQIVVDGSFIMASVDEPGDIDLILILPKTWNFAADLPPFRYNVLSKRRVRKIFGFDMLIAIAGQPSEAREVEFFSRMNLKWHGRLGIPPGVRKGLIRISK